MSRRRIGARTIEVVEEGSGTPVVFLHGNQVDHRDLMVALDPLFEREASYRRLHLDLPGYGASPPDPTIVGSDGMLEAALELIDGLVGNASFVLVGCSWGGYLARGVVARWPERILGVALVCPVVVAERSARDLPP
ncbi:MAG TPA: alpha/beta fold hydrolase, partial [Candidatus Saccharimonadales bacterium]|nr:alpha/beta fold hydrolase [Candidatus Saccharimonadales bacterium]